MSDSTTAQQTEEVERPPAERGERARWSDRLRLGMVAGCLLVLVVLPFVGEKSADWGDVRDLVRAGKVTEVHVSRELPASASGFAMVQVRWQRGPVHFVTYVRQVRDDESSDATSTEDVSAVLHRAPSVELAELQPGLRVDRGPDAYPGGPMLLGFEVPLSLTFAPWILTLLGLVVLGSGPSPWRATPWAWFWWLWHPVGAVAFALLSGPFPGIRAPRRPDRRLTGGWSFLLTLAVASMSFSVWGVRIDL